MAASAQESSSKELGRRQASYRVSQEQSFPGWTGIRGILCPDLGHFFPMGQGGTRNDLRLLESLGDSLATHVLMSLKLSHTAIVTLIRSAYKYSIMD